MTCQMGSRMLASAPASKIVRRNVAVRSVCRTPGAILACTSAMACSVIRKPSRMADSSSGVLDALAVLITRPASLGAPEANKIDRSRRSALVHSSMATKAPLGTSPPSCGGEELHALVEIEVDGTVEVIRRHLLPQTVVLAHGGEEVRPLVAGHDNGDRLLEVGPARIAQRPDRPGGIRDICVAEQHESAQPVLCHDRLQALHALALHAGEVRGGGDPRRWRLRHQPGRHQSPTPR